MYTHIHIYSHTRVYIYMYIYIYIYMYTHIHIYSHTHTYIYIYIHINKNKYIYTRYHTPTTPQGGEGDSTTADPWPWRGGGWNAGPYICIYIYIKSRYVFTGNQGVSSLATGPLGPRWPPAKLRSFTSLQMVHTHTHLPASICLNSWCFNPLLSGDVKWKPAGHKKSVSICFLRNYPSQQNAVLN